MADTSKLIIQSLQQGKSVEISQRDYLLIQQYCEGKGIELDIVSKKGLMLTVKKKC